MNNTKAVGNNIMYKNLLQEKELRVKPEYNKLIMLTVLTLMLFQMSSIFLINFRKATELLDYDSALTLRHIIEMWKKRQIFLEDYVYTSTLEIDSVAFFAIPLYLKFGHLGLFLGLFHVCIYFITALVLCDLFCQLGRSRILGLIGTVLLFTPFAFGQLDWDNMLFFSVGQYQFRVLFLFLFADVFFYSEKKDGSYYIRLLLCSILDFWTSLSCGNYIILSILSPYILYCIFEWAESKSKKQEKEKLFFLFFSIILSFGGYFLHNVFAGVSINNNKTLIHANDFMQNLENCLTGVFMLFGGLTNEDNVSVFSLKGILGVFKFFLVLLAIISTVCKKEKGHSKLQIITMLTAGINLVMLILAETSYGPHIFEYRYHILWCSLTLLCLADFFFNSESFFIEILSIGMLSGLVLVNIFATKTILDIPDQTVVSRDIIKAAEEAGVEGVYLYDMPLESNMIRFFNGDLFCDSICEYDGEICGETIYFYKGYGDNASAGQRNILVAYENQFALLPDAIASEYSLVDCVHERNIYLTDSNPFDTVSGPPLGKNSKSVDFPYSTGYVYSEGAEGYSLYGPYSSTEEGVYDITLCYTDLAPGSGGSRFEVCTQYGENILYSTELVDGFSTAEIVGVHIPISDSMEFRLFTAGGDSIAVDKIVFEKRCLT